MTEIQIDINTKSIDKFISDYWDYKLHFEIDIMNRLEKEYRCKQ